IITRSPFTAMVLATVICLISIWGGLVVSAMFPAPPSFVIVTISTAFWILAKAVDSLKRRA
ncbi:MAG TPA: metal ABC transporter permease, partial [Bifidobacterium sp.]|nr:metal ABC transporter permease [Bifidobacterium sp.]